MGISRFFLFYLVFISFYHLFSTFLVWKLGINKVLVSILKDLLWFWFVLVVILFNFNEFVKFVKKFRKLIILVFLYVVVGIWVSLYNGIYFKQLLIGFKYDVLPILIFLTALFLGYLLNIKNKKLQTFFYIFTYFGIFLIINFFVGIFKILFPKIFYAIGYSMLGNFLPNKPPPVYYTSGVGGLPRLSGLFGGPNEFGFFLSFFLPIFYYFSIKLDIILKLLRKKLSNVMKWYYSIFYIFDIISGIFTLSRGYILSVIIESFIIFWKKITDYVIISFVLLILVTGGLIILNKSRPLSTIDHFVLTKIGISYIVKNPLGYGLGTSGPSAYYTSKTTNLYEIKKKVPENTYLQIAIDMGIGGLVIFVVIILEIIELGLVSRDSLENNFRRYSIYGFIGFLVVGLFLHIFGDSMVVYLVFTCLGIILG